MKLELKRLAPYLPCGLKIEVETHNSHPSYLMCGLTNKGILKIGDNGHGLVEINFEYCKPILRPLSDLKDNHELFGSRNGYAIYKNLLKRNVYSLPYGVVEALLEQHYDIFNLIPENLAIDINTLQK